jgi:GTPase SAR1 family protein
VVSDITNANSLENAVAWKNVVSGTVDEVPIFLLQNKTDLITGAIYIQY